MKAVKQSKAKFLTAENVAFLFIYSPTLKSPIV